MGSDERERDGHGNDKKQRERFFEERKKGERAQALILTMGMTSTWHNTTDWHNLMRNREREGWAHSVLPH